MLLSQNEKTTGEEKEKQDSSGCRFKQNRVWRSAAVQRCSDICMQIRKFLFAAEQTIRIYSFNNFSKTQTHKPPVPIKPSLIYHPSEHSHPGFYCLSWPPWIEPSDKCKTFVMTEQMSEMPHCSQVLVTFSVTFFLSAPVWVWHAQ